MKIVVNAVSAKVGGAVSYITNLLRHWSPEAGDVQIIVYLPPETAAKLESLAGNIQLFPTEVGHAGMLKRLWWDQVTLRHIVIKEKADVLFPARILECSDARCANSFWSGMHFTSPKPIVKRSCQNIL
ncbi:MAG TPA: hypothetical protein VMW54_14230 [Terriglobia bacterium]|nr:hypothetical protein [Terriglobia bacterium]